MNFFKKHKHVFLYGASLAALLFLLRVLEFRLIIMDHAFEVYIGSIAVLFMALGVWLAIKLFKPKMQTIVVEKEVFVNQAREFVFNEDEYKSLGLSNRELEVLKLMAKGLSNQEIAEQLFISLNTIKTHSSSLFAKLDVKRRTQAVEVAKRLHIIP